MSGFGKKALIGIGAGLALEGIGWFLLRKEGISLLFGLAAWLLGTLFFIWGCTRYAEDKGLPNWLGYLGFLNLLGLVLLFILPSRQKK